MSTPSPMAAVKLNPFIKKQSSTNATTTIENNDIASVKLGDPVTANPIENPFGKAAMKRNLLFKKPLVPIVNNNESDNRSAKTESIDTKEMSIENKESVPVNATIVQTEEDSVNIDNIEINAIKPESIEQHTETPIEINIETNITNKGLVDIDIDTRDEIESEIEENNIDNNTENETTTEAPVKKRRRRTKQQTEDVTNSENIENIAIDTESTNKSIQLTNNSTVDFATICDEFGSFNNDNEWIEFINDVELSYNDIKITPDITSASLIGITCQLANLRDKIWQPYQYYKNQYDKLSSKEPEGLIERTKRIYMDDTANNDMKRKKSATIACMSYTTKDGKVINLYDFLDEVRARYYFLNTMVANIEFKKSLLVTINGALKLENNLIN